MGKSNVGTQKNKITWQILSDKLKWRNPGSKDSICLKSHGGRASMPGRLGVAKKTAAAESSTWCLAISAGRLRTRTLKAARVWGINSARICK